MQNTKSTKFEISNSDSIGTIRTSAFAKLAFVPFIAKHTRHKPYTCKLVIGYSNSGYSFLDSVITKFAVLAKLGFAQFTKLAKLKISYSDSGNSFWTSSFAVLAKLAELAKLSIGLKGRKYELEFVIER